MRQTSLNLKDHARRTEHGGVIRKGRRKLFRPMDPKRPMHLVFRSTRARGEWSLLRRQNAWAIKAILVGSARKNGVIIYNFANYGNHLHLDVKDPTRRAIQNVA